MKINKIIIILITLGSFLSCKDVREEYYENGVLMSSETYKDGIKNGYTKHYYSNGNLQQEGNFSNNKENGLFKNYYSTGELELEVNFKEGKQEGELREYYQSGNLKSTQNFKKAILDGKYYSYYDTGGLKMEALYEEGTVTFYIEYDSLGLVLDEYRVCKGEVSSKKLVPEQSYQVKFDLTGRLLENDTVILNMNSFQIEGEQFYKRLKYADKNNLIYEFTPPNSGKWQVVSNIYILRDKEIVWEDEGKFFSFIVKEES